MKKHLKTLLQMGALVAVVFLPSIADAQSFYANDYFAHYNRYRFMETGKSPRSAAMGGAYSALMGRDLGLLGNPASLSWQEDYYAYMQGMLGEVSSDVTAEDFVNVGNLIKSSVDTDIWSIGGGIAIPLGWGAVGLNYSYRDDDLDSGSFRFTTMQVDRRGDSERHAISVGAGYRVNDQLGIGYRYSYVDFESDILYDAVSPLPPINVTSDNEDLEGHKNHFGLQYILDDNWTLGLDGIYGLGDFDSTIYGGGDAEEWAIRGGVAWSVLPELPLLLALDVSYANRDLDDGLHDSEEDVFSIHIGAEYEIYQHLFLRAGYQYEDIDFDDVSGGFLISESPSYSGYSAGLGYSYSQFSFDYAFIWMDTGREDLFHYLALGINF